MAVDASLGSYCKDDTLDLVIFLKTNFNYYPMKLETRKKISIVVADIYTGEILINNCLELDLRYKNNRDILFSALFNFIEKCRRDEYISLEFQHTRIPIEQSLPF